MESTVFSGIFFMSVFSKIVVKKDGISSITNHEKGADFNMREREFAGNSSEVVCCNCKQNEVI